MELLIKKTDDIVEIETLFQKIEKLYKKISKKEKKIFKEEDETLKEKHSQKLQKLLKKLAKKKIKLYKNEIYNARKLKQNGILLPLCKNDTGSIYTDEVHDADSLLTLAKAQSWSEKCLWIDLTNNRQYILYM